MLNAGRTLVVETGNMFAITLEAFRLMPRRPVPWRDFIRQSWFIASVSMFPAVLVSIAFGATIALQVGNVARQLGAESQTGAAMVLAVVREAAPIVSAMCADIGSRKIRDEISAMEVLAVNPIKTLVVPRIWAAIFVAMLLDGFVSVAGIAGGYFFNVVIQGGTPGAYLASFSLLAQTADLFVAIGKAGIFGLIAAMVACYFGFYAKGGPKGVGDAVNRSVVVTFMLIFFVNFILTALYFAIVPQKFG
jgi:phospholipid/cholesterol/gamma-HCH transport system permease protein